MDTFKVEISQYNSKFNLRNKLYRIIWYFGNLVLFRPFGLNCFNRWRNNVLRIFGAKIGKGSIVYSNVKIWAPWNLELGDFSCLGQYVDCYNQGFIKIGSNTTISQKTYLCASSHDISDSKHSLVLKPITINNQVWVAADAFIGPGTNIGEGAVVSARAAVFKDVAPWTVVSGNPAQFLKHRKIIK